MNNISEHMQVSVSHKADIFNSFFLTQTLWSCDCVSGLLRKLGLGTTEINENLLMWRTALAPFSSSASQGLGLLPASVLFSPPAPCPVFSSPLSY